MIPFFDKVQKPSVLENTVNRFRKRGIILPTFAQQQNPELIPQRIKQKLKKNRELPQKKHPEKKTNNNKDRISGTRPKKTSLKERESWEKRPGRSERRSHPIQKRSSEK